MTSQIKKRSILDENCFPENLKPAGTKYQGKLKILTPAIAQKQNSLTKQNKAIVLLKKYGLNCFYYARLKSENVNHFL